MYRILEIAKKFKTTWSSSNEAGCTSETWNSRCNPTKGDACGPCQEATSLGLQIRQLEEDLATLRAKQSSNNAKINTAHDPLSSLPIELVSIIFMYIRPSAIDPSRQVDVMDPHDVVKSIKEMKGMKTPLVLGAICRSWRAFAWSIPQLWTTISIDVYDYNEGASDLVRQWFERSGRLPLSIYLYAARIRIHDGMLMPPPYGHESHVHELMNVINAYSGRWFYLNLNIPKRFTQRLHCSGLEAPMLEILTLQNAQDDIEEALGYDLEVQLNFGKIPNLRKVYIFDGLHVYDHLEVNWESVTHVESFSFTVDMAYELLRNAPFLTHFHVKELIDTEGDELQAVVRHDHLTSFQIKDSQGFEDGAHILFPFLVLPALEDFGICTDATVRLYIVDDLLRRSSCILKTLRVNITTRWMECKKELIALLETIPTMEILHLECQYGCYNRNSPIPSQFPTTAIIQEMDAMTERIFSPNVKEVHIKTGYNSWSYSLELLLHPQGRGDFISSRADNLRIVPWNALRLKPLFIYYLLDPATQQTIQPVVEGFSSTSPPANVHPFMGFLFQTLYRYVYEANPYLSLIREVDAYQLLSGYSIDHPT